MILLLWSIVLPHWVVLASTVEISNSVNRWFRRSSSISENGIWAAIFLAIVLLWVGLYFWDRSRNPRNQPRLDREGLFLQLCDLHKLSKSDRQLLWSLARTQGIAQPALAFVNPHLLLKYAKHSPRNAGEIRRLADRLFGKALVEEVVAESVPVATSTPA